jgi:hypothetical protein
LEGSRVSPVLLGNPTEVEIVETVVWVFYNVCCEEIKVDLFRTRLSLAIYMQKEDGHTTEGKLPGTDIFIASLFTVQAAVLKSKTCVTAELAIAVAVVAMNHNLYFAIMSSQCMLKDPRV